jgi:excisionase family DNA binding protein
MEKLWDTNECAEYLHVKSWTVRAWVSQKRIPFIKLGRLVRFQPEKITRWLEEKAVKESDIERF